MPAVESLRKGVHPTKGTMLAAQPRRLCKRDIGTSYWSGEGCPEDNWLVFHSDDAPCTPVSDIFQHADEEEWEDLLLGFDIM